MPGGRNIVGWENPRLLPTLLIIFRPVLLVRKAG